MKQTLTLKNLSTKRHCAIGYVFFLGFGAPNSTAAPGNPHASYTTGLSLFFLITMVLVKSFLITSQSVKIFERLVVERTSLLTRKLLKLVRFVRKYNGVRKLHMLIAASVFKQTKRNCTIQKKVDSPHSNQACITRFSRIRTC